MKSLVFAIATLAVKTLSQPVSIPVQPHLPMFTYDEDVDEWIHPNYPSEDLKEAIDEWCDLHSPEDKRDACRTIVAAKTAIALRDARKQEGALIAAFKQVPREGVHGLTPKFFETVSSIYNPEFGTCATFPQIVWTDSSHTRTRYQVPKQWHLSYTLWCVFIGLKQLWKLDTDTRHHFLLKDLPIML